MDENLGNGSEGFATYLAKYFIGRKGYEAGTVPEAAALADASDIVLTYADGISFNILCLIDREANPGKIFALTSDAVHEVGTQCQGYTGTVNGNKIPVLIQIMEVGGTPSLAADQTRLKDYKRKSLFSKVNIDAWIIDTAASTVWCNRVFNGLLAGRSRVEDLLKSPRLADAELFQPAAATLARTRFPALTLGLLAVLVIAFVAEQIFQIGTPTGTFSANVQTLIALGGLNQALVLQSGEWYRLLSSALLHGGPMHLLMNGIALYLAGSVLENLVGRAWFMTLFVLGALGGSLMSLALNPPDMVSVGASGAIMGLLAAAFVCSFRLAPGKGGRAQIQMATLQMLIPSLLPMLFTGSGGNIDYASHLGGTLVGAVLGMALLKTWSTSNPLPGFTRLARGVAIAGVSAFAIAVVPLAQHYPGYAISLSLIPDSELPKSDEDAAARADQLVTRYPGDPRAHYFQGMARLNQQNLDGAVQTLRDGLEQTQLLKAQFKPDLEYGMRTLLALALLDQNHAEDAKRTAQPACADATEGPIRAALDKAGLCR